LEILAAGDGLQRFPNRGRAVPGTRLRETTLARPYIIRYRVAADHVRILRVRHGARRPTRP
jgi:plasmid stabilization system protein ParE